MSIKINGGKVSPTNKRTTMIARRDGLVAECDSRDHNYKALADSYEALRRENACQMSESHALLDYSAEQLADCIRDFYEEIQECRQLINAGREEKLERALECKALALADKINLTFE